MDDFDKNAIRRKVHQFFNDDPYLSTFKRATFYKLFKTLNFKFKTRGKNSLLLDKTKLFRPTPQKIKRYREEKQKIYYLDETWINAGHTKSKVCFDILSTRQAFLDELLTGFKKPIRYVRKNSSLYAILEVKKA